MNPLVSSGFSHYQDPFQIGSITNRNVPNYWLKCVLPMTGYQTEMTQHANRALFQDIGFLNKFWNKWNCIISPHWLQLWSKMKWMRAVRLNQNSKVEGHEIKKSKTLNAPQIRGELQSWWQFSVDSSLWATPFTLKLNMRLNGLKM